MYQLDKKKRFDSIKTHGTTVKKVLGFFAKEKVAMAVDHPLPSSTRVKNKWTYTSIPPMGTDFTLLLSGYSTNQGKMQN